MDLEKVLRVAVRGGASDVILKTGAIPRFRFHGNLVTLEGGERVSDDTMRTWVNQLMPSHLKNRLAKTGDVDFAFTSPNSGERFRINLFRQRQHYAMVLRIISSHVRTLEELQLPQICHDLTQEKRGLVLVTGATGCGKSTTLAAMVQKVNLSRPAHIITIEDPIEVEFEDASSTVQQREIGIDADSFASALRASLRQDPDIILVGELRDADTTATALMAAETGHLVFSTLHTADATESLTRLMSFFQPHQHQHLRQVLANCLRAVISQRLVSRLDGKGRVAATEVLSCNSSVRDVILNHEHFDRLADLIKSGDEENGMQSFDQSLIGLYHTGMISRDEALAQASNRNDLNLRMQGVVS